MTILKFPYSPIFRSSPSRSHNAYESNIPLYEYIIFIFEFIITGRSKYTKITQNSRSDGSEENRNAK